MTINLVRVINQQTLPQGLSRNGSILLDKIDRSQGNSESPPYAQLAKRKVYVPFKNPLNVAVKGYVDLVPSDDVLLAAEPDGSIGGLTATSPARVTVAVIASNLIATPTVSAALHDISDALLTITGTVFLSISPDLTYVELTNVSGAKQLIPQSAFGSQSGTVITVPNSAVSGVPTTGWFVRVFANSKYSNRFAVTDQA